MTNKANSQLFVFRAVIKSRLGEKQINGWFGVQSVPRSSAEQQAEGFTLQKLIYTIQQKRGNVMRKMVVDVEDMIQRYNVLFYDMYNANHPLAPAAGQNAPVHPCSRIAPWAWKLIIDQYRPTEFVYWAMHSEDVRPNSGANSV